MACKTRRRLFNLKNILSRGTKMPTYESIINTLLGIKDITFSIEHEGTSREINGIFLSEKLKQGWKLTGYKIKGEIDKNDNS